MIKVNVTTTLKVFDGDGDARYDLPPGEYELERRGTHLYVKGTTYHSSELYWDDISDLYDGNLTYINEQIPPEVAERRRERLVDNPDRFDRLMKSFVEYYYSARWEEALINLRISSDLWRELPRSGAEHQTKSRYHRLIWHHIMLSSMLSHMNDLEIDGAEIEIDHPDIGTRHDMITQITDSKSRLANENIGLLDTSTLNPFNEAEEAVTRDKNEIFCLEEE